MYAGGEITADKLNLLFSENLPRNPTAVVPTIASISIVYSILVRMISKLHMIFVFIFNVAALMKHTHA